jgi:hypothetical protein
MGWTRNARHTTLGKITDKVGQAFEPDTPVRLESLTYDLKNTAVSILLKSSTAFSHRRRPAGYLGKAEEQAC